jgi:hypothetical protein
MQGAGGVLMVPYHLGEALVYSVMKCVRPGRTCICTVPLVRQSELGACTNRINHPWTGPAAMSCPTTKSARLVTI